MSLPEMITSVFGKIQTGILDPVLSGLYQLIPFIMLLSLVGGILMLIFSPRASGKVGGVLLILLAAILVPNIPDFFQSLLSWFDVSGTGAESVTDAANTAAEALDNGSAAALDSMR